MRSSRLLALLASALLSLPAAATSILFVGNSFTYGDAAGGAIVTPTLPPDLKPGPPVTAAISDNVMAIIAAPAVHPSRPRRSRRHGRHARHRCPAAGPRG